MPFKTLLFCLLAVAAVCGRADGECRAQQIGACSPVDQENVYIEGTLVDLWEPGCPAEQYEIQFTNEFTPFEDACCRGLFHMNEGCSRCGRRLLDITGQLWRDTCLDYEDFYSCRQLTLFGIGLGAAAILANTSLDQDFQHWHDTHVKTQDTDEFAAGVKWLGEGKIMIPVFIGAAVLGQAFDDSAEPTNLLGDWGSRCTRSVLVGGPPVLVLKYFLNGSRPEDYHTSQWRPFQSPSANGAVSGHAFIGATPFINAAMMAKRPVVKAFFYGLSILPAWSRVNDRMHYLSQAVMGWWLAYLAADSVNHTNQTTRSLIILPEPMADGFGVRVCYSY